MAAGPNREMQIGQVLKDARARAGLELRAIEERTKIRTKYLRAIENEEWDALPSSAYAKGFLRSYAEALGLDGEALVDEYRRRVESVHGPAGYGRSEQALEGRRRLGERGTGPRPALVVAALVLIGVVVALVIGLDGGDRPGEDRDRSAGRGQAQGSNRGGERSGRPEAPARGTVTLGLKIREPVEICLLGGAGQALIDGQVLAAGTRDAYERERFELRFPSGFDRDQLAVELDQDRRVLPRADGPVAYMIVAPQRIKRLPAPPGERCP